MQYQVDARQVTADRDLSWRKCCLVMFPRALNKNGTEMQYWKGCGEYCARHDFIISSLMIS